MIQDLRRQRAALASVPSGVSQARVISGMSLDSAVSASRSRVLAQREKVDEAMRLRSDTQALRNQYDKLADRSAGLRQEALNDSAAVTLMEGAQAPDTPDSPNVGLILIGSFALGLGSGVFVALIVELMRRRVRSVEDLSRSSDAPVIGVINAPPTSLALT